MDFVDEEYDFRVLTKFVYDGFHAFLELPAVGGSCDHSGDVERDDTLVSEHSCLVAHYLECNPLDDCRLADAGFSDEDGVVLLAAAEDLYDSLYLDLASNDGV